MAIDGSSGGSSSRSGGGDVGCKVWADVGGAGNIGGKGNGGGVVPMCSRGSIVMPLIYTAHLAQLFKQ